MNPVFYVAVIGINNLQSITIKYLFLLKIMRICKWVNLTKIAMNQFLSYTIYVDITKTSQKTEILV